MTHLLLLQALPYVCLLIAMLFFIYAIIGMQVSTDISVCIPLVRTGCGPAGPACPQHYTQQPALCLPVITSLRHGVWQGPEGGTACLGAAKTHPLGDLPKDCSVKLHSCLPNLSTWRCGLGDSAGHPMVAAAFKSPPLFFTGNSVSEMTPHLQLPSSSQSLISCLKGTW